MNALNDSIKYLGRGVLSHIFRVLMFESDGQGLPASPGGLFATMTIVATAIAVLRHSVFGNEPADGIFFSFILTVFGLAFIAKSKYFEAVSIYLFASIGIDLIAITLVLIKIQPQDTILGFWEFAAFSIGWIRCHRIKKQKRRTMSEKREVDIEPSITHRLR